MDRKVYSREEMEQLKMDVVNYGHFHKMDRKQQWELLNHYQTQFTNKELSEYWGITVSSIYTMKYQIKKAIKEEEEEKETNKTVEKTKSKKEQDAEVVEVKEKQEKGSDHVLQMPVEYISQVIESPKNEEKREVKVSLDEFMKMIEIQEKIAKAVELQQQQKDVDGFQFKFDGEFTAEQLEKRLKKILAIVEDEPYKYQVKLELRELNETSKEEDDLDSSTENELVDEVHELREKMRALEEKEQKDFMEFWKEGYQSLESDVKGMHHPKSEYNQEDFSNGKKEKNGKMMYQTFYICNSCGNKGKHFVPYGHIYINCHKCGKRMRIRHSVSDDTFEQDSFGNYYIAGKFKRAEEIEKEKPLTEIWNIN